MQNIVGIFGIVTLAVRESVDFAIWILPHVRHTSASSMFDQRLDTASVVSEDAAETPRTAEIWSVTVVQIFRSRLRKFSAGRRHVGSLGKYRGGQLCTKPLLEPALTSGIEPCRFGRRNLASCGTQHGKAAHVLSMLDI